MRPKFYDSIEYKEKQAARTRKAWQTGTYNYQRANVEKRTCKRAGCKNYFEVASFSLKIFCSSSCSVSFSNQRRGLSLETKSKISVALLGSTNVNKGKILVSRVIQSCPKCGEKFEAERWKKKKYCSVPCLIRDIGSRRTSPKAARGKSGIREDIDATLCFYSRWEANFARILNVLKIKWEFQPKEFDLRFQKYTPDFYLPDSDEYIEIKNFMSDYSKKRDDGFRKYFPDLKLRVVLKKDYLALQESFSPIIEHWEFS